MIAFQMQLNLRNRDVIMSKPQKKADENRASTSSANKSHMISKIKKNQGMENKLMLTNQVITKNQGKKRFPHKISPNKLWKKGRI